MIAVPAEVMDTVARISVAHPEFREWLQAWRQAELERLPNVGQQNVALAQGRCQVLGELTKFITEAPDRAAKR